MKIALSVIAALCAAAVGAGTLPPVTCSSATNQAVCTTPQATVTINHLSRLWTVATGDNAYTALNPPVQTTQVPPQSPATYDQYLPPTVFVAADGSTVTVELHLHYFLKGVSSGRAHYTIEEYTFVGGMVTLP